MIEKKVKIISKNGLHLRPCGLITDMAQSFNSDILIIKENGQKADAKNIMEMAMMAISNNEEVTINVNGSDENEALNSMASLVIIDFSEFFEKRT